MADNKKYSADETIKVSWITFKFIQIKRFLKFSNRRKLELFLNV